MDFLTAIILSLIQGATEFLPVSSSGHLALAGRIFKINPDSNVPFAVLVHLGTLLAIVFVFRGDIWRLIRFVLCDGWKKPEETSLLANWTEDVRGRMVVGVILATIPTALIGFLFKDFIEGLYDNPTAVGCALLVTAALLGSTFLKKNNDEDTKEVSFPFWMAMAIGCVQAGAIVPGISRSGSTIAVAILLGMRRRLAGEFSFLIAIPAIAGAVVLELPDLFAPGAEHLGFMTGLSSLLVSAVSGYVFLRLLLRFVRNGTFGYFAFYCAAVGIAGIVFFS